MLDLVCLGNLTIDDVVLPDGSTCMACFGGDAIYAALSARLWSDKVAMVAPIGNDYPPTHLIHLQQAGFGLDGLPRREAPTFRNWVIYEEDGRRTWVPRTEAQNLYLLSPVTSDIPQKFRQTRAYLILAMDLAAQEDLIAGLSNNETTLALDPQEDNIVGNETRVLKMLKRIDVFLPSEIEVERLLGHRDFPAAARYFTSLGCKIVAIKMGANGSLIYEARHDQFVHIPIAPTNVMDTTGAGDSFSGGFMARYAQTGDIVQSGYCGSVSASFAIERFGANPLFDVTRTQANQRLVNLLPSANNLVSLPASIKHPNQGNNFDD